MDLFISELDDSLCQARLKTSPPEDRDISFRMKKKLRQNDLGDFNIPEVLNKHVSNRVSSLH